MMELVITSILQVTFKGGMTEIRDTSECSIWMSPLLVDDPTKIRRRLSLSGVHVIPCGHCYHTFCIVEVGKHRRVIGLTPRSQKQQ
jgi:hypothetical protein